MDYRYKDIYITIMPGLVVMTEVFALYLLSEYNGNRCIQGISLGDLSIGHVTIISLFFVLVGYIVNIMSSILAKNHIEKNGIPTIPACFKEKIKFNVKNEEMWHYIKDYVSPNDKIEEYFVRYSQARNLMMSFFLGILLSLLNCFFGTCTITLAFFVVNILLLYLTYKAYKKSTKRYYQVFLAEFVKQYNQSNPTDQIDFAKLYTK